LGEELSDDVNGLCAHVAKGMLEKLLARSEGIRFSEHITGDRAIIFAHACKLGLEGIVSKRRDLPYRSGRCKAWRKVKNPASVAVFAHPGRNMVKYVGVVKMVARASPTERSPDLRIGVPAPETNPRDHFALPDETPVRSPRRPILCSA
jgi:hypothetical protein